MKRTATFLIALAISAIAVGMGGAAISGGSTSDVGTLFRPSDAGPERLHANVVVDGGEWSLTSRLNTKGEKCVSQSVPGEGVGTTCLDPARIFADGRDVLVMPGARQRPGNDGERWDNIWLHGFARSTVAKLELVNLDCSVEQIAVDADGAFMHVVSRGKIQSGSIPYKVVGRDSSGNVVHAQDVSSLIGVPYNAERAGVTLPKPRAECGG